MKSDSLINCDECYFRAVCGGMDGQQSLGGCMTHCHSDCLANGCAWTCPNRDDWLSRWEEVGGWPPAPLLPIRSPGEQEKRFKMPRYLPVIQHGYSRASSLVWPNVAIPTFKVVRHGRNESLYLSVNGASDLRKKFKVAPLTQILMVSVSFDDPIERYWQGRRVDNIPAQLSTLDAMGITTPNFSFFSDAPRTHTLWNRTRIVRVAEELSAAGMGVILHLNAQTRADWRFWTEVLRDQPQIRYVAKEFQTGLHNLAKVKQALDDLAQLQQEIGRDIHPVMMGAMQFAPYAASHFNDFTIVDSSAFLKAMSRRVLIRTKSGHWNWQPISTAEEEPLDSLLFHNIWQSDARLNGKPARIWR